MRALSTREKRLILYLAILIVFFLGDYFYRYWSPDIIRETEHYVIYSTATPEQTDEIAEIAEIVYEGYLELAKQLQQDIKPHPKLKMKLFKNRKEFRRCNRFIGWAEAFYKKPYCYQYYSSDEDNPYHWMMHEATHQLNAEAANLSLSKWIDEGIACYISTSRIIDKSLRPGEIDIETYPVWWLASMAITGDLDSDKNNMPIIPLREIIYGKGGPDMDEYFNLYYLHWWSLTHFLMQYEGGKYRGGLVHLIADGGGLDTFEKHLGKLEDIEKEWHGYILDLKQRLSRTNAGASPTYDNQVPKVN